MSFAKGSGILHYSASAVGGDGCAYGTGALKGSVDFGGGVVARGGGIFVVKYDSLGTALKAWSISEGYHFIRDLYVDAEGNFYYLMFGWPERENFKLVKRNADFEALWEVPLLGFDVGETTLIDDGYVLTSGEFEKPIEVQGQAFEPVGREDMICLLFDPQGELVWSKTLGRPEATMAGTGALKLGDSLYFSGNVKDVFSFDGVSLLPGPWLDDFVMRLSADGKVEKAVGIYAGEPSYMGRGLFADEASGIYVNGVYQTGLKIQDHHLENRDEVQNGYVAKFDTELDLQWLVGLEVTEGLMYSLSAVPDRGGRVFVTGSFSGAFEMGEHRLQVDDDQGNLWFMAVLDAETGAVRQLEKQSRRLVFQMVNPLIGETGDVYVLGRVSGVANHGDLIFARMNALNPVLGYALSVENVLLDEQTGTLSFEVLASPPARIAIERRDRGDVNGWKTILVTEEAVSRLVAEDGLPGSDDARLYRARLLEVEE